MTRALEDIIRIRAVQDMSPAQAAGFMLPLKTLIREELGDDPALFALFERIDRLALEAFDTLVRCKVKIYDLRGKAVRTLSLGDSATRGMNEIVWDARNNRGQLLPRGTYIAEVRAQTENGQTTRAAVPLALGR